MATQRPAFSIPLTEFAAALLAEREVLPRARITAQQVADIFSGMGVVVYTLEEGEDGKHWTPKSNFEITLQDQLWTMRPERSARWPSAMKPSSSPAPISPARTTRI